MSVLEDIKKLKTEVRDLRKFGLTVGGMFVLIGAFLLLRHKPSSAYFIKAGAVIAIFGWALPRALKYVYVGWMTLAFTLGFVMSNVILALFFFLFVTPIGLLARLFQKDFLARKWDKQTASYWIARANEKRTAQTYERQF